MATVEKSDHPYDEKCQCCYCSDARSSLVSWRAENADRVEVNDDRGGR